MKAFYSTSYGAAEASRYGDFPDPSAGSGQVLVEVKAVSVNPVDYKVKRGDLRLLSGSKFPKVLGTDFGGIVKEVGSNVSKFKPGDRVSGVTSVIFGKPGALAQLLAVNQKSIWTIPPEMNFEEAASLPVGALTALNGLRKCGVSKGTRVLINGGTGGVGHFAIQIAKSKGAYVTVTCSDANAELARKLGADETVGYTPEAIAGLEMKFDAIFDAFGHMKSGDVYRLLKRGKTYASTMLNPLVIIISPLIRLIRGRNLTSANLRAKPEDIEQVLRLFLEKKLQPVIEHYYTLEKSEEAFDLAERGKLRGKIIIRIL